jgi:integrase/recombinase XerD
VDCITLFELFEEDCALRNITSSKAYRLYCQDLASFLEKRGKDVQSIDRVDLKAYLVYLKTDRKVKFATIERIFTVLNTFYTFMVEENYVQNNPIPSFRKRYLRQYKSENESEARQIISIEDAAKLVHSILSSRDRAIAVLLFKTGMRCGELKRLDIEDIDLDVGTIQLKPTPKRSNRTLFLDSEAISVLRRWLEARKTMNKNGTAALFIGRGSTRLCTRQIKKIIADYAARVGLHNPESDKLEDRFTPHCCRHWFTTHLIRSGMPRDFVKELRGDARHEAIDIYNHIDKKELRESYLAHIPQLGV